MRRIQPEDILPGDIDANLGAPWIPVDVIRDFAAGLFGVGRHAIQIDHLPKDALWTVAGDRDAEGAVTNTEEFGTRRIEGLALLEQALNLRTPKIYDEFRDADGGTKRVVNQEQTVAALEKQKRIKQRFSGWIFSDPDRAERLVRIYNDTFNNLWRAAVRRIAPDLPRHEPDGDVNAAPDGRRLARRQRGQHASRACRRRRQDLRDGGFGDEA